MEPVIPGDPVPRKWIQDRLNGTLSVEQTQTAQAAPVQHQMGNQDMAQMLAPMGTSMGNTLAKLLKPMAEAQTKEMVDKKIFSTEGKQYDALELAKIKGWSNVDTLAETQLIWRECQ